MDPATRAAVRKKLEADHNCTPVFLTQEVNLADCECVQSTQCCYDMLQTKRYSNMVRTIFTLFRFS